MSDHRICGRPKDGEECKNLATYPHWCPYGKEINDDQTECDCCEECEQECADDI